MSQVVTKTANSPSVIEFTMDEKEFEDREANGRAVFEGVLNYRAPGKKQQVIQVSL